MNNLLLTNCITATVNDKHRRYQICMLLSDNVLRNYCSKLIKEYYLKLLSLILQVE